MAPYLWNLAWEMHECKAHLKELGIHLNVQNIIAFEYPPPKTILV